MVSKVSKRPEIICLKTEFILEEWEGGPMKTPVGPVVGGGWHGAETVLKHGCRVKSTGLKNLPAAFRPLGVKSSLFFWAWRLSKIRQHHQECKSPCERISNQTTPQIPQQTVGWTVKAAHSEKDRMSSWHLEKSLCPWWAQNTWV